jgi:hypothetical protein
MKTLSDLTPEISAKIPEYIAKYTKGVFDGERYNNFKYDAAVALIDWNYEQCKYKKPCVLVAENPYEAQIFFNYIKANEKVFLPIIYTIYCIRNGIEVNLNIPKIENKQLNSQLYSQLDSQLYSQLYSQLDSQLYSQLDSQLDSQLYSQLYSQLDSQLYSQLYSQLDSQLYSQLDSQLDSQLRSQLYSQLNSQLNSQLRSQLDSQLNSQLRSQLDSQLDSQLKTKNPDYLFTSNVYSGAYGGYYKFLADELKIDTPINVMLNSWNDLYQKSNVYSAIFSELLCVVSKYPKKVHLNENNDMHRTDGHAAEWSNSTDMTKFNGYYINGRNMPEWIFSSEITKEQFINEENEDIKAGIYEVIESKGEGTMLTFLGAKEADKKSVIHGDGSVEELILYKTTECFKEEEDLNGRTNVPLAWIKMCCPSTGTNYLIPTDSSFTSAIDAAKFARPTIVPQELEYNWLQRN